MLMKRTNQTRRMVSFPKRTTPKDRPADPHGDFDDMGQGGRAAGYYYGQKTKRGVF